MINKKADIWISAVLYIALGIIVIALLLASSLPLIDKIKDRNTFSETKQLLLTLDDTIKIVAKEGPGSQRELSPLTINKGQLFINPIDNTITWKMKTSAAILEPDVPIKEGVLSLLEAKTPVVSEYVLSIRLNYEDYVDLQLQSDFQSPFSGRYSALVQHTGSYTTGDSGETYPIIKIKIL